MIKNPLKYPMWCVLLLTAGLGPVGSVVDSPRNEVAALEAVRGVLHQKRQLKPLYTVGKKRYYRLWQTLENLDQHGYVQSRSQWRGDFRREVKSIEADGKAYEQVTWKNVGMRSWNNEAGRYDQALPVPWAEGFSYLFSAEEDYTEFEKRIDYSTLPKSMFGFAFRGALQVTAHVEFDYLRSSHHAAIERLQLPGQLLQEVPEEGTIFSLDFPPVVTESALEREFVQVGFLGLTLLDGEPCAVLDYRQGPQDFSWKIATGVTAEDTPMSTLPTGLKSWHYGVFFVRLSDGSLMQAELTEHHVQRNSASTTPPYSMGIWTIREITEQDFEEGLASWNREQAPRVKMLAPGPTADDSSGEDSFVSAVSHRFDLKPELPRGDGNFYRLRTTLYFHDRRGNLTRRLQWSGDFERRPASPEEQASPHERIVWRNVGYREAVGGFDVSYGPHTAPPWAQEFSYLFSAEASYEDFPWERYSGIPKTEAGYQFKLHTVNAHFEFDFLRSSHHGAIEKLQQIGDRVEIPDNGRTFSIDHPPVRVNSRLRRQHATTRFLGFSQVNGEPCALLEFQQGPQPFSWDHVVEGQGTSHTELTSRQYGLLFVRLSDGVLRHGELAERGIMHTTLPNGETQPGYFVAIIELNAITPGEFREGLKNWHQEQPKRPTGRVYNR